MAKIKFISYDGAYPVLCSGKLTVEIDGKTVTFGKVRHFPGLTTLEEMADYPSFWCSGGSIGFDDDWNEIVCGGCPWEMSEAGGTEKDYPPEIWKILPDILAVMNENVRGGCCGGCI